MKRNPSIKCLTYLSVLVFCFNLSYAQIVWQPKSNMPTPRKEIADAVTVLDDKIYVLGGRADNGILVNTFECYDPELDTWTTLAPYPISIWRTSIEAINGKIYVMGGYQSLNPFPFNPTNKTFVYDPLMDSWTALQDMPISRGSAASVTNEGKIHLIGGANNSALTSHHVYDPVSDTWSVLSSMNEKRSGLTAACIDNKIYAVGGYFLSGGVVSLSSAEEYDPQTNSWSTITNLPYSKLGTCSAVIDKEMYVFGNENNLSVLKYKPTENNWEILNEMPEDVNFAGAATVNEVIYLIGGGKVNLTADGIGAVNCMSLLTNTEDIKVLGTQVNIYPNPSTTEVHLDITANESNSNTTIQLYNTLGQLVTSIYSGPLNLGRNRILWSIPNNLLAGQYNVSIIAGQQKLTMPLVINSR